MLETINQFIQKIVRFILIGGMIILVILVTLQVLGRYLPFISYAVWSEELARFLFIWMVFLGCVSALITNSHIGIDFVVKKFSETVRAVLKLTSDGLILWLLVVLFVYGVSISKKLTVVETTTLPVSIGFLYIIFPISSLLMMPMAIGNIIDGMSKILRK